MNNKISYSLVLKKRFSCRGVAFILAISCWSVFGGLVHAAESATTHQLKCSPKTFTRGDLLNIEMGVPHPDELAIVRPDGEFFFIAERVLGNWPVRAIPSDIFRGIVALRISPKTLMAHRFRKGTPDYEMVFNKVGTYKVILGGGVGLR